MFRTASINDANKAANAVLLVSISLLLPLFVCFGCGLAFSVDDRPQNQTEQKITTIDPGVHLFPPTDFPETLAKWIKEHPEHMVCAMSVHADGYIVVTRVDPKWLNNVLPGGAKPPMGMSRPDQE